MAEPRPMEFVSKVEAQEWLDRHNFRGWPHPSTTRPNYYIAVTSEDGRIWAYESKIRMVELTEW